MNKNMKSENPSGVHYMYFFASTCVQGVFNGGLLFLRKIILSTLHLCNILIFCFINGGIGKYKNVLYKF
jgi:hypothetical protein